MQDADYYIGAMAAVFCVITLSPRSPWFDIPLLVVMAFLGGSFFESLANDNDQ